MPPDGTSPPPLGDIPPRDTAFLKTAGSRRTLSTTAILSNRRFLLLSPPKVVLLAKATGNLFLK
jgi:hypothetical protein